MIACGFNAIRRMRNAFSIHSFSVQTFIGATCRSGARMDIKCLRKEMEDEVRRNKKKGRRVEEEPLTRAL